MSASTYTLLGADRRLLPRLDAAWDRFTRSYAGMSEAELLEPGITEEEALKHVPLILAGGRPPRYSRTYGGIDAFNARMTARKEHLALADVLEQQQRVHARLLALIERVPTHQLGGASRVRRRLRLDTYGHYPLHASAIETWRSGGSRRRVE